MRPGQRLRLLEPIRLWQMLTLMRQKNSALAVITLLLPITTISQHNTKM